MMKRVYTLLFLLIAVNVSAQNRKITGIVSDDNTKLPISFCTVVLQNSTLGTQTNDNGAFELLIPTGNVNQIIIGSIGYISDTISFVEGKNYYPIKLKSTKGTLGEVVVTGTLKEVSRMDSPIPVEVITPKFFRKNPTPNLFEAVGMINGVQPQIGCNVCNTGDIHINGMEGPYTMILIDGMPIVSSLSTVYGLSGIPNSIVERVEVVKGPASSLYGSEAMGGVINVITKKPSAAPLFAVDVMGTTWNEYNIDVAGKLHIGAVQNLVGVNYFNYSTPYDKNNDGFTDVTLQDRVSVFNKVSIERKNNRIASLAARYVYEDRWGGEMNWNNGWRGSDSIYGESIYTKRWELIGMYQLPIKERVITQFSYNWHDQNSFYGNTPYMAVQRVAFAQVYWDKEIGTRHSMLLGASYRHTYYDDNTTGTALGDSTNMKNDPAITQLPGIFIQDEWKLSDRQKLLLGYRYDYDRNHGNVHSPRLAYKLSPNRNNTIRASIGTGYRVVNLFTEDHAALSGARDVIIVSELKPERSYNSNLNYVLRVPNDIVYFSIDVTGFYSYFTNKIVGDFDQDPTKIIYDNLDGNAISKGVSLNTDLVFNFPLKIIAGVTYMDVFLNEDDGTGRSIRTRQLHAPKWSGNFVVSYTFPKQFITIDLTGKWNGPMRLPILPNDYRPEYSPWYSIVNIQLSKKFKKGIELYGGVKNIFDFVPKDPIMRPFDPFDKRIDDPIANPNGYTFDPSYNYASMQGIRGFFGIRYTLDK